MKISVVGNCQAIPLADCLRVMNPAFRVERLPPDRDPGASGPEHLIVRQRERRTAWTLADARPGELLFPRVWFNAFHPDVVTVPGPYGSVPPPLGTYHSSLALYAWHRGLPAAEAVRLFCEPVFERLGFFDCWSASRALMVEEGRSVDFPIAEMLPRWERRGSFMHAPNHPALFVMADVARELARRAGLALALRVPERYIADPLFDHAMWPLYPGIAERLGLPGTFHFKLELPRGTAPMILDLGEFVERTFQAYATMAPEALACARLASPAYQGLEAVAAGERKRSPERAGAASARAGGASPYAGLPDSRFWTRAVSQWLAADVDPVSPPPFRIGRRTRIATAGSCFAQHMSSALRERGYTFYVAEPPPPELSATEARDARYGVFSTRSGNVYTARQLVQLFDRAYGTFSPSEPAWLRPDGRYADPFRVSVEPNGFASADELAASRERHLAAVRTMFEKLDVLIFTLGLTEAWRSSVDGAVFSAAPGSAAGSLDPVRHEFVNFSAAEVRADLDALLIRLRARNPGANVVLTVSPVPLTATYEPHHVLVATTYSKAALCVAAHEIERAHANVWYFPSYELVTGAFNRGAYFERDLRSVTRDGVEHVIRLFLAHCADDDGGGAAQALSLAEHLRDMDVVCDDEEPRASGLPAGAPGVNEYARYLLVEASDDVRASASSNGRRMERVDRAAMRTALDVDLPSSIAARTVVSRLCTVTNRGEATLVTGEPHPVYLSYRWYDDAGMLAEIGSSIHTPLDAELEPGAAATLAMRIEAPRNAGRYVLRVSLVQSNVAWFDDVDGANGVEAPVACYDPTAAAAAAANHTIGASSKT